MGNISQDNVPWVKSEESRAPLREWPFRVSINATRVQAWAAAFKEKLGVEFGGKEAIC